MFPPSIQNKIGYYVYLYIHPETNRIFYIGQGKGNRAFDHLTDISQSEKGRIIQELKLEDKKPRIDILIHGLSNQETARRVETAVIDLIGMENLSNKIKGWGAGIYGRMPYMELIAMYNHKRANITEPAILLRINEFYRYGMEPIELYDATRGRWRIGKDREKAKLAFAVFEGVIKEVYEILGWYPALSTFSTRTDQPTSDGRWEFVGNIADQELRTKYINKSVSHYFKKGGSNPVRYVNVKSF